MTALLSLVLAASPSGTATVPLNELVELLQPATASAKGTAVVTSATLVGRPGEAGLWLEAAATARVVGSGPVEVPLLEVGPLAVAEALSDDEKATAELRAGVLVARCHEPGVCSVTARLLLRGGRDGKRATASFGAAPGLPPTPLKLDVDDGLFELPGAQVVREWGGYVRFAERGRYDVAWVSKQSATRAATTQRAPVEPLVREATSRWVTTLEGRATHELKLVLQVDRPGALVVEAPVGQRLVRARVNGVPVPGQVDGARLTLEVGPVSLGAAEGTVELAWAQELGVFHLSGQLELASPRVSWPVSKWTTQTVLPKVFRYVRLGGSMEQLGAEADAEGALPGRSLQFTQHLITSSAPTVSLGYSVDLTGSYFR
ncbi:MAG: hypothetical protein SFW67_24725 [Myxococcaceae bacterium]|nr:hypothetical protein [Myxococcaceae bacterium]